MMDKLPKDILNLIIFNYLDPFDAINFICTNTIFYGKLKGCLSLLRKHCYAEMNRKIISSKQIKIRRPFPGDYIVCICGVLLKRKNHYKHNKKCLMRSGLVPNKTMNDICQHCGLKLISWDQDEYDHFLIYHYGIDHMINCAGINKITRDIYWRKQRQIHKSYIELGYDHLHFIYEKFCSLF